MDLCHCCMCKRAEKTTQSAVWGRGGGAAVHSEGLFATV